MRRYAVALSLPLLMLTASPAWAHVSVEPKTAPADGEVKLTFLVPHGCDGTATTGFQVKVPGGIKRLKPKVHAGWTITEKTNDQAKPTADGKGVESSPVPAEVAWTGGSLPDAYVDEFEMVVTFSGKAGDTLKFEVTQECEKGTVHWSPTVQLTKA